MKRLPPGFFSRPALEAARDLIGKILVAETSAGKTCGIITETEAYCGEKDPACHTYQGRRTPRNRVLYEGKGLIYIYLIYGMYYCLNITAGAPGENGSVFIRALDPLAGLDLMKKRRGKMRENDLCSGPGRLCEALGIDKSFYGENTQTSKKIYFLEGAEKRGRVKALPRIGIDYAGKARTYPWRFVYEKRD